MPAQDRVGCHKCRDVAECSSTDAVPQDRQPPPLLVRQTDPATVQLRLQHAVFFVEECDHVALLALQPAT